MDEILLTEISAGVATVTLNRPRQMNASTAELRRRFGQVLEALGAADTGGTRPGQPRESRVPRGSASSQAGACCRSCRA